MVKRLFSSAIFRAAAMIFLSITCMLSVNILRRPSVDSVTALLLSLPGYSDMSETDLQGAYTEFGDMQVKSVRIFTSNDGSAREFAVVRVAPIHVKWVMAVFQNRVQELLSEYKDDPEELHRIQYFRIINNGEFVTFTVYDANYTAENAIHEYFNINKP